MSRGAAIWNKWTCYFQRGYAAGTAPRHKGSVSVKTKRRLGATPAALPSPPAAHLCARDCRRGHYLRPRLDAFATSDPVRCFVINRSAVRSRALAPINSITYNKTAPAGDLTVAAPSQPRAEKESALRRPIRPVSSASRQHGWRPFARRQLPAARRWRPLPPRPARQQTRPPWHEACPPRSCWWFGLLSSS